MKEPTTAGQTLDFCVYCLTPTALPDGFLIIELILLFVLLLAQNNHLMAAQQREAQPLEEPLEEPPDLDHLGQFHQPYY